MVFSQKHLQGIVWSALGVVIHVIPIFQKKTNPPSVQRGWGVTSVPGFLSLQITSYFLWIALPENWRALQSLRLPETICTPCHRQQNIASEIFLCFSHRVSVFGNPPSGKSLVSKFRIAFESLVRRQDLAHRTHLSFLSGYIVL